MWTIGPSLNDLCLNPVKQFLQKQKLFFRMLNQGKGRLIYRKKIQCSITIMAVVDLPRAQWCKGIGNAPTPTRVAQMVQTS